MILVKRQQERNEVMNMMQTDTSDLIMCTGMTSIRVEGRGVRGEQRKNKTEKQGHKAHRSQIDPVRVGPPPNFVQVRE